ncbi:capsid protein [Columbid circovirus]|uniref:Capsid protein n=1 Tax=Pigeon circovirus TaxID=126070 RepID=W8DWI1_PICV|nr:capsid protein [Columbid circovirus]
MRRRRFRRRRAPIRRRRYRRRRRTYRNRRSHRSANRVYYFRLRRKDKITLNVSQQDFKFGSGIFTFKLADVLTIGQGAPTLKVPFEDYQIPLVKVEMRPLGVPITTWKGFGHTCPIYDARLKTFQQQTDLGDDPLMDFDGARKWDLRKGFKRLIRPKPKFPINDLATSNQTAATWFSNQRNQWIPLQTSGGSLFPTKVNYYGLAFSYLHPAPDPIPYEVEVTLYVKFRQFAWTTLNVPPTPNIEGLELMHVCDGDCNQCWATENLDADSAVDIE